jgi:hypothetical protein
MKDLKDFGITCALIGGVMWLFRQIEDSPQSVGIPIYADGRIVQAWPIPAFLLGMYWTFTGKRSVVGLLMMGGVAFYLFGGAL